jgi:GT2 family glycosyltransferase
LEKTRYSAYEVVLVDNGSQEEATHSLYKELLQDPRVRVCEYAGHFNFSAAVNLGARQSRGEVMIFLNNDTQVIDTEWLDEMVRWACRDKVGGVGAMMLYPNGTIQHAGIVLGLEGHASHIFGGLPPGHFGPFGSPEWYRNYSAVTGACLAVRRAIFDELGGFDETFELVFSDVDFCLRAIQAGYRNVYTPYARLFHYEGRTRSKYIPAGDIQVGAGRFEQIVKQGDPFYNPNLSYSIRRPVLKRTWEETPIERLGKIVRYYS